MSRARVLVPTLLVGALVPAGPAAPAGAEETGGHHMASDIQERIDASVPGAVVMVAPGMYHGNLVIRVPVTLRGVGDPLIIGDGTGTVLTVEAPGTVVTGLRIQDSAVGPVGGPAGVKVLADDVLVQGVVVENTYMGIAVMGVSGTRLVGNVIRGRVGAVITDEAHAVSGGNAHEGMDMGGAPAPGDRVIRGDGISLWNAADALVRDNVVEDARDGIYISFGNHVLVDRNRVLDSRYAIHSMFARHLVVSANTFDGNLSGLVLMNGGPALLLRNTVEASRSPASGFGILLKDVAPVDAMQNVLVGNRVGIQVDGPAGDLEHLIEFGQNTVALNEVGVSLYPSAHAVFYGNSFVENTVQVLAQGTGVAGKNRWSYQGAGNYWSDYRGYDLSGDGVGDIAHAEGGSVESILARAPVLTALASGPAFSLIRAVEDRWVRHDPVALDRIPLTRPVSPAVAGSPSDGRAPASVGTLGLLGVLAAATILVRYRRPRGRPARRREPGRAAA